VREVIRNRTTTRVPGAPNVLRGLVNVRGMVVTVLDLATCLAPQPDHFAPDAGTVTGPRAQTQGSIVLLEHGSRLVGLAVDSVREVRSLDDGGFVGQPGAEELRQGFVRGLASAGGEVVTVLDVAALISRHLISGES
jgi:purine-binding chemotaxis protein CheW